jgi:hypothetical protein
MDLFNQNKQAYYTSMQTNNLIAIKTHLEKQIRIIDGIEPVVIKNGKKMKHYPFTQMKATWLKVIVIIENELKNRQ